MPAKIVETRPRPFKRVKIDPITLDIIENAMLNARHEMDTVLFRTAMSPGIREQRRSWPRPFAIATRPRCTGPSSQVRHGQRSASCARGFAKRRARAMRIAK